MSEETTGVITPDAVPEATPDPVATLPIETPESEDVPQEAEQKTFTQAELDAIVQKEKAKAAAIADRRALKAYRETLERLVPQQQQPQAQPTDGRPTRSQYANDDDYVEAMADWKIAQREQSFKQQQQQRQAQATASKTETIYAKASEIPGFDREAFDELPLTPAIAAAIVDSDVPEKLMHYLSTNPDEVAKIAQMNPIRQAAAIGKLEAKVSSAPQVSKAPEPIKPIGGNKGGSKDPSEMTDAEFAAWRRRQIAQRR